MGRSAEVVPCQRKLQSLIVSCGVLLSVAAQAGGSPATGSPSRATTFRLSNGLRVHIEEDHRLPVVAVTMTFAAGAICEAPGTYGFAHLFEHIMFTATGHINKAQHDTLLESVGALEDGNTAFDLTNYYAFVPSEELETVLWIESDRMGFLLPALTQERLQSVKDTVLNELKQRVDGSSYGRAYQRVFELAFPEPHPYHGVVIGRAADISAARLADVARFFGAYYMPANAVLVLVGDVRPAVVRPALEKYFGTLPGVRAPKPPTATRAPQERQGSVREVIEGAVPASRVTFAWRVPAALDASGEDVSLDILAELMGDARFGVLPRQLIEAQRLLTDARCEHSRLRLGGLFQCDLTLRDGVDAGQVEAAFDRLLAELAKGPPPADVAAARVAWRASLLRRHEDPLERARHLAWFAVVAGDALRAEDDVAAHAGVTPAMLGRVATRLLAASRFTVIVKPRRKS